MTQKIEVPKIPLIVRDRPLYQKLAQHLSLLHRGKVRQTWALPDHPELLLVVATDQISIFDFVLPVLVPQKGYVLTAMNIFWKTGPLANYPSDLIAYGRNIDRYLPAALRSNADLQRRGVVVRKLMMLPVECVARACLTGSGWKDHQKNKGLVCGHQLPLGLNDGALLEESIFTPASKSEDDHDENIDFRGVRKKYGEEPERRTLQLFAQGCRVAEQAGIVLADTKFEFGIAMRDGHTTPHEIDWPKMGSLLLLGDEALTPDSSRFWPRYAWKESQSDPDPSKRKSPSSLDKQFVRDHGDEVARSRGKSLKALKPGNPDDRRWVHENVIPPEEVIVKTSELYQVANRALVGKSLEEFQESTMHCVPL